MSACRVVAPSGCSSRSSTDIGPDMKLGLLKELNTEGAARRAAVVLTELGSGEQRLVKAAQLGREPLREMIEQRIRSGKSGIVETDSGKLFVAVHVPPPQLVITGAVHISQVLAPIAA